MFARLQTMDRLKSASDGGLSEFRLWSGRFRIVDQVKFEEILDQFIHIDAVMGGGRTIGAYDLGDDKGELFEFLNRIAGGADLVIPIAGGFEDEAIGAGGTVGPVDELGDHCGKDEIVGEVKKNAGR